MLPAQFLAVVAAAIFPLAAEIDCGPLALRSGTGYRFWVVVESFAGKTAKESVGVGRIATPADVADGVASCLLGMKVTARRQGAFVTATDFYGAPVRNVRFEFDDAGPKPAVKWVPRSK